MIYRYREIEIEDDDGGFPGIGTKLPQYEVTASNFMAFHNMLHKSEDFTEALRWARDLTDTISETLNKGIEDEKKKVGNFSEYVKSEIMINNSYHFLDGYILCSFWNRQIIALLMKLHKNS
jgi:hypothetical protein